MNTAQTLLRELGLPEGDRHDFPTSTKTFPDGAHYRVEIPSVQGPAALRADIEAAPANGVPVPRISQGSGSMLLSDAEIEGMVQLGHRHGIINCVSVSPGARL